MSRDSRLHYVRSLSVVDSMYDRFFKTDSLEDGTFDYYNGLYFKNYPYLYYDLNNMNFLCCVALMGLNKESTEKYDNHKEYKYDISYSVPDYDEVIDAHMKKYNIPKENRNKLASMLMARDSKYKFLTDARVYPTPFDMWLRINKQNQLPNFTYNYLSCVRDAFMHSEYEIKESPINDSVSTVDAFVSITNSDYKKLEGDIFLPNFFDFAKFYYSNTAYYGIMGRLLSLNMDDSYNKLITSYDELESTINAMSMTYININNDSLDYSKSFEATSIKNKGVMTTKFEEKEGITYSNADFTENNKKIVINIIKKYFGDTFFTFDINTQKEIILYVTNYVHNPKVTLSAGLIALYENFVAIGKRGTSYRDISYESYCVKPLVLLLKSYIVLYRLQNKSFEGIDYNKMNLVNFTYSETDPYNHNLYNDFKNKQINRGIVESDDYYQKMYFTEIFRDALAHGNIGIDFNLDGEDVEQQVVFNDIYKGKTRTIKIGLEDLRTYLASCCFSRSEAILKEEIEEPQSRS